MFGSDESNKVVKPVSRRRVLKPPGGGSSDIFGTSSEPAEPQRKTKNHLASSAIFGGDTTEAPSRNKSGNDSFYNLFGSETLERPVSAVKDKFKSNIILEDETLELKGNDAKRSLTFTEEESKAESPSNGDTTENTPPKDINGVQLDCHDNNTATAGDSNKAENGVTQVNGSSAAHVSAAPTPAPTPTSAAPKQRVPPGGFSSGLW